eukprot:3974825-Prymnesium_polylepis.1
MGAGLLACVGGAEAGNNGDGYCAQGYHGPRCELCRGPAYSSYFDKLQARCRDCGNVTVRGVAWFCAAFLLLTVVFSLGTAAHRIRGAGTKSCKALLLYTASCRAATAARAT